MALHFDGIPNSLANTSGVEFAELQEDGCTALSPELLSSDSYNGLLDTDSDYDTEEDLGEPVREWIDKKVVNATPLIFLLLIAVFITIYMLYFRKGHGSHSNSRIGPLNSCDEMIALLFTDIFNASDDFNAECFADVSKQQITYPRTLRVVQLKEVTVVLTVERHKFGVEVRHRALVDLTGDLSADVSFSYLQATHQTLAVDPSNDVLFAMRYPHYLICDEAISSIVATARQLYVNHESTDGMIINESDANFLQTCRKWLHAPLSEDIETHAQHYTRFNRRTNELCTAFGAHCDVCKAKLPFASIQCIANAPQYYYNDNFIEDNDNVWVTTEALEGGLQRVATLKAKGVRNSVGFDWQPETEELWFADNGAENLGAWIPDGELNRVSFEGGEDFGFPFCHSQGAGDPIFRDTANVSFWPEPKYKNEGVVCDKEVFTLPMQATGPHSAPSGVTFIDNRTALVALQGADNGQAKLGHRVDVVELSADGKALDFYNVFVDGFVNKERTQVYGRPVDIAKLSDRSVLVSDDYGAIYHFSW